VTPADMSIVNAVEAKPSIAHPAIPLVDAERARRFLADAGIDLLCVKNDEHLYYLSGYFSDSSLCHFYDDWACVAYPTSASIPGTLFVPDYDLAYQVTKPTWLPQLRAYGSEWSSAGSLLKEIYAGVGVETDLRAPLRELFAKTRPTLSATLTGAVTAFIDEHFAGKPLTIGCDDLRYAAVLGPALGDRASRSAAQGGTDQRSRDGQRRGGDSPERPVVRYGACLSQCAGARGSEAAGRARDAVQ
jgi:hypothetical protein